MRATREEMDDLVNRHFGFEASDDVDGVMSTLADGAEHEVIPSPVGSLDDPVEQRAYYELLFSSITGESVEPIRRYYGEGFLVDETLWHGTVDRRPRRSSARARAARSASGSCTSSRSATARSRREQVWCDLAAIQRQLGCAVS